MKKKADWEYYRDELITLARNANKVGVIYPIHGSFEKAIAVNQDHAVLHYGLSEKSGCTKESVLYTWNPSFYKRFNGYNKCKFGERLHP